MEAHIAMDPPEGAVELGEPRVFPGSDAIVFSKDGLLLAAGHNNSPVLLWVPARCSARRVADDPQRAGRCGGWESDGGRGEG